jgi:NAD kinase
MNRQTENKIIFVTRNTRLDDLMARFNTLAQTKFYIEHLGADFSEYVDEHQTYYSCQSQLHSVLKTLGRVQPVDRAFLPNFVFGPTDTVVVLGQDGLVANTLKYSKHLPVVGVNPDPRRWEGVLVPFPVRDVERILPEVFAGRRKTKAVTMAKAHLNDGQTLLGVNDLFIGVKSHVSARYSIQFGTHSEFHSSSGIVVSTGMGSTGWFRSLITGAIAITSQVTGQTIQTDSGGKFAWDSEYLYFTVREPFPSRTWSASLVFGQVTRTTPLVVVSQMAESGVIFSDGIEQDYLEFNSGTQATITVADEQGHLVI